MEIREMVIMVIAKETMDKEKETKTNN